jgi:predicted dinucleotide-binding enzyme
MGDGRLGNGRIALFLAGDDPDAVATVAGLAEALHFEPVVVGGLAKARLTEAMAVAWISLARGGFGRGFAFGLLRDDDA